MCENAKDDERVVRPYIVLENDNGLNTALRSDV